MMIKDEIHGNIYFNELEERIVDTPDFQRLRRIKQMAFTYLVYPGANHTRFEHSIGVFHLASVLSRKLGLNEDDAQKVRLFALLHDIGHLPFSHESEKVLEPHLGTHENIGRKKVLDGEVGTILNESWNAEEIMNLENAKIGQVVCSDLGADRMDYLVRDSANTGVAYGVIDTERIIHTMEMEENETANGGSLLITEGGLEAAESLLIARFLMFSTVYLHRTVRIAAAIYHKAIQGAISEGFELEKFTTMNDDEILSVLSGIPSASSYVSALLGRKLYKEAFSFKPSETDPEKLQMKIKKLEDAFKQKYKCDVIVEYPSGFFKPIDFKIKFDTGIVEPISRISDIVAALKTSEEKRRKVMVMCPEEMRDKISEEGKRHAIPN
ncbi:TPA: HD domain-containing protein [Candidatus Micrarchaeota archaeon]|nr:HD domain-containing protein [Candidatus Micrarchaeota archaeon]